MEDRRSAKTKKAIRKAFLELLEYKKINQITVVEISKLADLGRGTFYLHYKDVYDLLETLQHELISNLEKVYDTTHPCDNSLNMLKFTELLTEYMEANRELFLVLARSDIGVNTLERLKYYFYQKLLYHYSDTRIENEKMEVIFVVSGVMGVLEAWLKNNMITSEKSISLLLQQILVKFEEWYT